MLRFLSSFILCLFLLAGCKKSADTPAAIVPERLEITPQSLSLLVGETTQLAIKYFDQTGVAATLPAGIIWRSVDTAIVSVNSLGSIVGKSVGQTTINATYKNAVASILVTVTSNNLQLATIQLTPQGTIQILKNQTSTLMAKGKTNNGMDVNGLTFNWNSSDTSIVSVNSAGMVMGKNHGTAMVSASANGITSAPVMVQVIKLGTFSGSGSGGMAILKIENNILKLETSATFFSNTGAPDLRIYLTNNSGNINGALEVSTLNQRSGAQTWNIAAPTTINQYRYVLIWCKQFGGAYGVADMGN